MEGPRNNSKFNDDAEDCGPRVCPLHRERVRGAAHVGDLAVRVCARCGVISVQMFMHTAHVPDKNVCNVHCHKMPVAELVFQKDADSHNRTENREEGVGDTTVKREVAKFTHGAQHGFGGEQCGDVGPARQVENSPGEGRKERFSRSKLLWILVLPVCAGQGRTCQSVDKSWCSKF